MAAKGRKQSKRAVKKVVEPEPEPEPEPESSDEDEVDLETMEKMVDSDSEATSEEDVAVDQEEEASSEEDGEDESENESESDVEMKSSEDEQEDDDEDVAIGGDEKCNIDLRNLIAFNTHQVNHNELFKKESKVDNEDTTTIIVNGMKIANEEHLLEKANEGCSQLLAGLWKLDTEKTDAGPLAILPSYFETKTPRALVSLSIYIRNGNKCLLCVVSNSIFFIFLNQIKTATSCSKD